MDTGGGIEIDDLGEAPINGTGGGHPGALGGAHDATKITEWLFKRVSLDRKLQRHHISGKSIGFSGTIGIGLFVTSGELVGISGSAGCVVSFVCAGLIIIAVMRSLAELVSVRPVSGALMDYPHTFVDPALGFAVGVTYWLAQCMSMCTLTAAAARAADSFLGIDPLSKASKTAIIIGLCVITLFSNVFGVKTYGNFERFVKWLKLCLIIALCILMIAVNLGLGLANQHLPAKGTNYTDYALPQNLSWIGYNATAVRLGADSNGAVIKHGWGQFLGIWTSTIFAMFACIGADVVIVTAGEAESPRKDLPSVTRFMYLAPIGFYVLASFLLGFNINYSEPNLFHPWADADHNSKGSHSPFILVLKYTSIRVLPNFLNACFLFSAYTAANTSLFSSSRTLFALAQDYGNKFLKDTLGRTNNGHTPVAAIFFCSLFGLLALVGLGDESFDQPILTLSAFFTGAMACVYASECIAYLRFKHGLTVHHNNFGFSRDSEAYIRKHYRAHGQPYWAGFGLFGCIMIIIFSGWPAVYLLGAGKDYINQYNLKPRSYLAADVGGAYSGPIFFLSLYFGYKIVYRTQIQHFQDFKKKYFLPEFDDEPLEVGHEGPLWKFILAEVWSYVK